MTCVKVVVLTGRLSANGLNGEDGIVMDSDKFLVLEFETSLGAEVVEEDAEVGVGTTVCSSKLVTTCGDKLMFGHIKVPLGLQIWKPLFSLCIFAALSSAALLPTTIGVSADFVFLTLVPFSSSLVSSTMFSANDVGPSNNAGGVNDSDIGSSTSVGFSIPI